MFLYTELIPFDENNSTIALYNGEYKRNPEIVSMGIKRSSINSTYFKLPPIKRTLPLNRFKF